MEEYGHYYRGAKYRERVQTRKNYIPYRHAQLGMRLGFVERWLMCT